MKKVDAALERSDRREGSDEQRRRGIDARRRRSERVQVTPPTLPPKKKSTAAVSFAESLKMQGRRHKKAHQKCPPRLSQRQLTRDMVDFTAALERHMGPRRAVRARVVAALDDLVPPARPPRIALLDRPLTEALDTITSITHALFFVHQETSCCLLR